MSNYPQVRLGDVATIKGGKRLPNGINLVSVPNSHPYIRIRNLTNIRNLEITKNFEYVDDETQKAISRYIVNENDLIISIVGTVGLISVIGKSLDGANLTENCAKIVNLEGIDRYFLYYFLTADIGQQEIRKGTVGAVQPKLPLKISQIFPYPFPLSPPNAPSLQPCLALMTKSN
jgi:type I restriction enzyme S subunit